MPMDKGDVTVRSETLEPYEYESVTVDQEGYLTFDPVQPPSSYIWIR